MTQTHTHTHAHTHTHLIRWQGSKPFNDEDGGGESTEHGRLGGTPGARAGLKGLCHVLLRPESGATWYSGNRSQPAGGEGGL